MRYPSGHERSGAGSGPDIRSAGSPPPPRRSSSRPVPGCRSLPSPSPRTAQAGPGGVPRETADPILARASVRVPREIGQLLEVTETARTSGVMSLRYVRRVGNTLYVWVDHLRISIAENDRSDIELDRTNCQILYELIRQSNPSSPARGRHPRVPPADGAGGPGDPVTAFLRLQLDLEKYRFLYPLHNLNAMTDAVMRLQRDGKRDECLDGCDLLLVRSRPAESRRTDPALVRDLRGRRSLSWNRVAPARRAGCSATPPTTSRT